MPFTLPALDALNFTTGISYTPPYGLSANFTLSGGGAVQGNGAVVVDFYVAGRGAFLGIPVVGVGAVAIDFYADGHGKHGVKAVAAVAVELGVSGGGRIMRYELAGEVRKDGIAVDRLVRAHRRDTGELAGEALTVGGRFRVAAGFVPREHYLVPIDMGNDANDWLPPCANRVMSELAMDDA